MKKGHEEKSEAFNVAFMEVGVGEEGCWFCSIGIYEPNRKNLLLFGIQPPMGHFVGSVVHSLLQPMPYVYASNAAVCLQSFSKDEKPEFFYCLIILKFDFVIINYTSTSAI